MRKKITNFVQYFCLSFSLFPPSGTERLTIDNKLTISNYIFSSNKQIMEKVLMKFSRQNFMNDIDIEILIFIFAVFNDSH